MAPQNVLGVPVTSALMRRRHGVWLYHQVWRLNCRTRIERCLSAKDTWFAEHLVSVGSPSVAISSSDECFHNISGLLCRYMVGEKSRPNLRRKQTHYS